MASSSSSSSSEAKWRFDVFLSFRGEDVRRGFLADLHRALLHGGINAYIDSEDLRPGDEISPALTKAIEDSRIAVLVFSENYASSRWCLDELVKVMECKRLKGQLVLPVFYRVEPREIRGQRESYGRALAKHEEKLGKDSERVKKWRETLIEAANLSGWHYDHGDDTKFIESIVKEISTIVGRVPLSVAKYPVGVGCRVEKVMSLFSTGSDDVRMIGIWGTGGIGKTTVAKDVYNSIASQFDGCSFLPNVRETSSKPDGLVHLQKTLLSEILWKENLVVFSVDGGVNLIRDRLCSRKILLVLDDVDHGNQLNALAGECEWFGEGSRIIITTRDKHVLTAHRIDQVYEVKALDQGEAFELLRSYAFPGNQTKDISRDLIDNILGYANGLPLAIVVLGPFLCGRSRGEWESTLEKLGESPNKDINSVLKISFDALEDNEKDIFLDIACFFKGRKRHYVTGVLDSCGLKTLIGIQTLIERSLVTIEDDRSVQMHDLIQLMGQDIVKQECPNDPGKRSRLWCYDDVFEVLLWDTGTNAVKGIVLQLPTQKELDISPSAFTHMRRLKLLILLNAQISGGSICLPNDLRWLEWPGCPLSTLKFSAVPKKLICFDVHDSRMKEFGGNLKDFQNIKFLNVSECQWLVCMHDLDCTPYLEELHLHGCQNLERVHQSIAFHGKLRLLNLQKCSKLQSFVDIPDKNKGLRGLILYGTSIKELPTSIENLVSLEGMDLRYCKNLAILPSSIYRLQNLTILRLRGCSKLIKFPKEEEDSSDPHTKTGFPMLEELDLNFCCLSEVDFLENLSCFPRLRSLQLMRNNFTNLPSCGHLYNLLKLNVSGCQQLREILKIPRKLRELQAASCKSLSKVPSNICDVDNTQLSSCHELIRNGFIMDYFVKLEQFHPKTNCRVILPGREMPKWLLPNKEGYISFTASKNLYKKFLGLAVCVAFQIKDHVWFEYFDAMELWKVDEFGPNDCSHFHFSITADSHPYNSVIVKKCGFRLLCKALENNLEVLFQDDQLLDSALLYEVCNEDSQSSTEEESSSKLVHEGVNTVDFSIEKHRYSNIDPDYRVVHPGGDIPKKFILVEDDTISFMASEDLYKKFIGLVFCVVIGVEDGEKEISFDIVPHVNKQRGNVLSGTLGSFVSDHMWIQFLEINMPWGVLQGGVDFDQFEDSYLRFSLRLTVSGGTLKKLGYVIRCRELEDDLKIVIEDNQFLDPTVLWESDYDTLWKDVFEGLGI
ncbi:TMV resistance protein N-like isoform X2 [Syzygium oleosum]|uniref:TMV resistance protein N-like isoform X2 n=1 Tax=Syzygium oleosum TaxID=219896 RepID=UPI0024BA629C|nr:TMV resistance protein N-like isoform X2 [Syzygium oleosum]